MLDELFGSWVWCILLPPAELEKFFWKMFIGDALLGNDGRYNKDWGFLINYSMDEVKIAPVFDCGACLYPQVDECSMNRIMGDEQEIQKNVSGFPDSAIRLEGQRIPYAQFLMETENRACLDALRVIGGRVDLRKIHAIVDNTPCISGTHKRFLKTMLKARKEKIIDRALKRYNSMRRG